jgi:hypothetical protein
MPRLACCWVQGGLERVVARARTILDMGRQALRFSRAQDGPSTGPATTSRSRRCVYLTPSAMMPVQM